MWMLQYCPLRLGKAGSDSVGPLKLIAVYSGRTGLVVTSVKALLVTLNCRSIQDER